jgi:hypothetical protein
MNMAAFVAIAGGLVIVGLVAVYLAVHDWNPAAAMRVGVTHPISEYATERLGDIPMVAGSGHDGKDFFVQAHDPCCSTRTNMPSGSLDLLIDLSGCFIR